MGLIFFAFALLVNASSASDNYSYASEDKTLIVEQRINHCDSVQKAISQGYVGGRVKPCFDYYEGKTYSSFNAYCVANENSSDPRKLVGCN